ncbi:glycosyltransferase family 4 protein [Kordiimonas aquimaris]|uniref:glycosyltransferase family 4 protein n=1 Tax=Kordiimonas aquimaris TaxID=707591 RepID=UPI0021CF9BC6|nr:glycosyltransferase family 1 protein [Kordiimonas aquimaris]
MPYDVAQYKPRRIALFSGNYNYVMDGPVRALNKLVGYLEKRGIEVLVFAPTAEKAAFQHQGTLVSVPSVPLPGRGEYRIALGLPKRIRQKLIDFAPDMIHLAAPDILGRGALKWAEENNVPAVASFHTRFDTYPRYYKMAWLEKHVTAYMRRFYHRCEQIYVPSPCMAEELQAQNMAHNIGIWSRGVDTELFNPKRRDIEWRRKLDIADSEAVIAFVGRLVLEKGLGVFADTLDLLAKRGIKFKALIVGDGPERERFTNRLPDAIFTGYLNGDALARAYASSDIFFNASITETFGNVTLEAMACGLPAVCANATGSRSLVSHNENGFLAEKLEPAIFADHLQNIIETPTLKAQMAAASLHRAQDYTWDAVLSRLFEQYSDVMTAYAGTTESGHVKRSMRPTVSAAE